MHTNAKLKLKLNSVSRENLNCNWRIHGLTLILLRNVKNRYLFQRKSMRSFIFISCIPISIEKIASIKRHETKKAIPKLTFLYHIEKHSKTIRLSFCSGLLLCPRKQSLKITKQNLSLYRAIVLKWFEFE